MLSECFRILKPKGHLFLSVPFLVGVHGDPADFQRWTEDGLRRIVSDAGFGEIDIEPMGHWSSVIADLAESYCQDFYTQKKSPPLLLRVLRKGWRSRWGVSVVARQASSTRWTTGYGLWARKPAILRY